MVVQSGTQTVQSISFQLSQTLGDIIAFLPLLVAAIIILVIGWILGRILGGVVATVLDRIGVDDALRKTSVGQYIEQTGTNLVRLFDLIVRWAIYLIAILAAVSVLQIPVLSNLLRDIVAYIPNVIAFILILVVGFILIDWFADFLSGFGKTRGIEYADIFALAMRGFLYFVVAVLALQQLALDLTIIYIFVTPIAWGVGLGLGAAIAFFFAYGLKDRAPKMMDDMMGEAKKETKKMQP